MICWGCESAEADPNSARYVSNCPECEARALSWAPMFYEAMKWKRMTPDYMNTLKDIAGKDWEALHQRVKKWALKRGAL